VSAAVAEVLAVTRDLPVGRVEVKVGPSIELDLARAAWDHIVAGTELEPVPVVWTRVFDVLTCLTCFTDYGGDKLEPCPACGGDGLVSEQASEIEVTVREVVA
jgi:hydrogenase nickel incorporation protein HypA/HybF